MILKVHTYQVEGIIVKADDLISSNTFSIINLIYCIDTFVIHIFLFIIPRHIIVVIAGREHLVGVITKEVMCLILRLFILIFTLIHRPINLYLMFTLTLPAIASNVLTEHALRYLSKAVYT